MFSIAILSGIILLGFCFIAWCVAAAARAAGSQRGTFRRGVACCLILSAFSMLCLAARYALPDVRFTTTTSLVITLAQLAVVFCVFATAFGLTSARALAPFGAYFGGGIVVLVLLLLLVRPYVVETFVIPTGSMEPTLVPGDRFAANKLLPLRRWDVVAYRTNFGGSPSVYCKRLVGLPGERLRFEHGGVYVNDAAVQVPAVLSGRCHADAPSYSMDGLPLGHSRYHDGETITLAPDEYFFIGDHIEISLDSRSVGPSKKSSLAGVVDMIYWPFNRFRVFR